MIIAEDSDLRRLPAGLNMPQLMFLDAIRYSIDMIDLAYERLLDNLYVIATDRSEKGEEDIFRRVGAIQDAWSIVDSAFRLRSLLEHTPHLKKKTPALELFFRQTKVVVQMRNVVQHLDTEMHKLIELRIAAWGSLSWAVVINAEKFEIRSCTMIPGTVFPAAGYNVVNPFGQKFDRVVDHITLSASSFTLNLSDVFRSVEKLANGITTGLAKETGELPKAGGDVLVAVDMVGNPEK